jgi:hypothetical protein
MDVAIHVLQPERLSWRVTPAEVSTALDTLESGSPALRPWVPLATKKGVRSSKGPGPKRVKCAAAINKGTLQPGSIVSCSVFGTSNTPVEHATGTFQVFPGRLDDTVSAGHRAEQGACPAFGPGLVLEPAIRKLHGFLQHSGFGKLASLAAWVQYLAMPLTVVEPRLCPVVKRMYLLASYSPVYSMLLSITGEAYWAALSTSEV